MTAAGVIYGPRGHVLKPATTKKSGHRYVATGTRRRRRQLFVHRAVLLAWVGPCPPGEESLHGNGVPGDNRLGNLRWGSRVENAADRIRHGVQRRGEDVPGSKLTADQVREMRSLHPAMGIRALARQYGVSHVVVLRIVARQGWRHVA